MKIKTLTFLTLGALLPGLSPAATLTNRWSFNGDNADSVGGQDAFLIPASAGAGGSTQGPNQVTLEGGDTANASYVDLGSSLISTNKQVTLELWATQNSVQGWSRIFDIGSASKSGAAEDQKDQIIMSWTQGTNLNSDRVEASEIDSASPDHPAAVDNTNQPYTLGTEFHIAMTLDNSTSGSTILNWFSADSSSATLGSSKGYITLGADLSEINDEVTWLGHSHYPDNTANASYNEVRRYSGILTDAELQANQALGPNLVPEPGSLLLGAFSLLGFLRRKR